ncbi:MAG: phosphatase PAP2 family protein [Verrucomicrobiota bacterium]|nr:phosphatase PAP2 family protein [Verrucomicrobiota bacterium]
MKIPNRWHVLPHEIVFMLFMGAVWVRVGFSVGFSQSSDVQFLLYLLSLFWVIGWCQICPTPHRWRLRLLFTLVVSTLCYFSLSSAVPLMHNPSGMMALSWHQDTALSQWDELWLGDLPRRLMLLIPPDWVTDIFMACYLFFFYYIVGGLLYYCLNDLNKFRIIVVGFCTVYALGYVGYMLVPAVGPVDELGSRAGGWLTNIGGSIIADLSNGVDVFPSIHVAASVYLLLFDFEHRRTHFWWVLAPTAGLWISTVYLRYHYGVDLIAGVILALGCVWLVRWFSRSRLCAEVEAECEAHGRQSTQAHNEG